MFRIFVGVIILSCIGWAAFVWFKEDPAIRVCEIRLKLKLKSPSSYQRVEANALADGVSITYDAANSYGAVLRDKEYCIFKSKYDRLWLSDDSALIDDMSCISRSNDSCLPAFTFSMELRRAVKAIWWISYPLEKSETVVRDKDDK